MEYLSPVPESVLSKLPVLEPGQLGHRIRRHSELDGIPSLEDIKIVIVGVQEDRRAYRTCRIALLLLTTLGPIYTNYKRETGILKSPILEISTAESVM